MENKSFEKEVIKLLEKYNLTVEEFVKTVLDSEIAKYKSLSEELKEDAEQRKAYND